MLTGGEFFRIQVNFFSPRFYFSHHKLVLSVGLFIHSFHQ